ncbi:MarR family transcriptional regulator [Streptomyces longwoodensis]|uniref:MarR family winged helix-turn-helix transcriptional regulator n=1 Tax=Streptomyces longwoodensis TaxID=68231 RepID=UPI002E804E47|nr:MarR family transcriptional regulator [Streptomyces longwoodensis]WUC61474.1 MarR family transcriptional regulator [Streptomyces longwoodensis]
MGCAEGADDGQEAREATARRIVDAMEGLVAWWLAAADGTTPRLPTRQLLALRTVRRRPEINLTALAGQLGIGVPNASRLCDRLEAAGLLERTVPPGNRREVRLAVTVYGQRVLADVTERRVRGLVAGFAHMTPAQRAALEQGLSAFHRSRPADPRPPYGTGDAHRGEG